VHRAGSEAIECGGTATQRVVGERSPSRSGTTPAGPFGGVPFAIKDQVLHAEGVAQRGHPDARTRHPDARRLVPDGPVPGRRPGRGGRDRHPRAGLQRQHRAGRDRAGAQPLGPRPQPGRVERRLGGTGCRPRGAGRARQRRRRLDPHPGRGLRPGRPQAPRGRTTVGPDYADPLLGLGIEFAVTRTVRDCAGLLDAVHGSEPGDRYLLPAPPEGFAAAARAGSRPLRIAVSTTPHSGPGTTDPECEAAVHRVADVLSGLGHTVVEAAPALDREAFDQANLTAWCSFLADGVDLLAGLLGITPGPDVLEATTLACVEHGRTLRASDLYAADRVFNATTRAVAAFHLHHDVLLTPTTCSPNTALGHLDANDPGLDARGWYDRIFSFAGFTALANVTGMPAISLPLATSTQGWPVGVQLGAGLAEEATLLALAADLEQALPWADRTPGVVAG
jgi:amidase